MLRKETNMRQIEPASKVGVSQGSISQWETGEYEPSIKQLIALADLFDVTVDYLIGRSDERK